MERVRESREIAVVGMSCRFPGGIDDIDLLWEALAGKKNTAAEVPADRWSSDWFYSEHAAAPGRAYVRRGNFLEQDVRTLDAAFFDLPPRVAENLDPQQRLMLETVWEAFENAGIPLPTLAGENVGVYVGGFMLDHMITHMNPANASIINQNTAAGMMMTMLSNRISHAFDLRGPSLSIDTACSSSLTAFNYGCRDVWSGACDVAVVGGVNIMTRPEYPVGMSKGQFLARDGECKSFDERGDGYGRGEGAGVVILKDMRLAIADGDHILAKVLATGVNSDGRTPGISMPSGEAQEKLARDVCEGNGIDPRSIHYIECHGTGTAIGDPTEAGSIGRVYGHGRTGDERAVIGTIKSNIGHTEAVAGVAGVIKAVLTLGKRVSSPLANLRTPNPDIPFEELGLRLSDAAIPLGAEGETLRAAINSFGYGGTNAHAILESAPPASETDATDERAAGFPLILPLSARSTKALRAMAGRLVTVLEDERIALEDVLHTSAHRRAHLSHRAVALGGDRASLAASLGKLAEGEGDPSVIANDVPFGGLDAPVFVYTGMGPQWWGMGQELYREHALFRETLDEADAVFRRISGFSILEEMLKDEASSEITRTEFAQPANFMIQLGLTALLEAAGVTPGAIVGHSVGEVGSAHAAGALSLEDALVVSYHRSRTQAKTAGTGTMLAVGLGPAKLAPYLKRFGRKIDIAAINGPATMTVSGDTVSIHALAEDLTHDEVFNRVLTVEVPYHSYLMDPICEELTASLDGIEPKIPGRLLFSTVSGERVDGVAYDGSYWADNVRRPVAFMESMKNLMELGYQTFVEIGPHPVLSAAIQDCARTFGKDIRLVETLRRGTAKRPSRPELEAVHSAVAGAYAAGAAVDWRKLVPPGEAVRLPNYPWQRERHWLETDLGISERIRSTRNPLLGYAKASAVAIWRNEMVHESVDYLYDHVVTDTAVMPAAGYIEMMLELGHEVHEDVAGIDVRDLSIAGPLLLNRTRATETITSHDDATGEVQIRSAESGSIEGGKLHVSAQIGRIDSNLVEVHDIDALRERFGRPSDVTRFYNRLAALGLQYGPAFRPVESLYLDHGRGEALASMSLREDLAGVAGYRLHPSLLDGCFQMLMGVLQDSDTMYLPTGFKSIRVMSGRTPTRIWCHGRMIEQNARGIVADLTLLDDSGCTIAIVRGMRATAASKNESRQRVDKWGDEVSLEEAYYNWYRCGLLDEPIRLGHWLVFGAEGDNVAAATTAGLRSMGAMSPIRVVVGDRFELGTDTALIRAGSEEDALRLLGEVGNLHGIAFMHGLSAGGESDPTGEFAIETILAVSKALATLPVEFRPRVYYVTRKGYVADAAQTDVDPAQTAIGAFMRVAHNELEGTKATLVDLPSRVDGKVVDMLVAELMGDAEEDEVAIRSGRRLSGVLELTDAAQTPTLRDTLVEADTLYRVRPSGGEESEGMVSLLELELPDCGSDEVRIRITDMSVPNSLLVDPNRDSLDQRYVAVVGEVESVGGGVDDLAPGERVFGYVPAEFASHVQSARGDCHLSALDASIDSREALAALDTYVIAKYAAAAVGLDAGDRALVMESNPTATAIAAQLRAQGVEIVLVEGDARELHERVEQVLAGEKRRFDALVAPLAVWLPAVGTECVRVGGMLVDCDATSRTVRMPDDISAMVRCDLSVVTGRPRRLKAALDAAAVALVEGEAIENSGLSVSLGDIIERRFDIPAVELRIDVEFDLLGRELAVRTRQRIVFDPDASYLVTGGLGGFGMRTASWLAAHGARTLVLASRSGANTDEKRAFVERLAANGVRVETPEHDLADRDAVAEMVAWIERTLPPLKGVFHSAAVIEDHDIVDLSPEVYRRVMRSKASSAWALHEATKHLPLEQFVCYSSIASVVGNRRQAAYAAANGYLSGLARHRRALGLHGLSIVWGAIGDVGVVADNRETEHFLKSIGIRGLTSEEALERMGTYLCRDLTEISCALMSSWDDWARYETVGSRSPRFARLLENARSGGNQEVREQLVAELEQLDAEEQVEVVSGLIAAVIGAELRQEPESISIDRPIGDLGVDSLMAVSIQLQLQTDLGLPVSVMDLFGGASIRALAEQSLTEFGFDDNMESRPDERSATTS